MIELAQTFSGNEPDFISDEQMNSIEKDNLPDFISDEQMSSLQPVPLDGTEEPLNITRQDDIERGLQPSPRDNVPTEGFLEGYDEGEKQMVFGEVAFDILENGSTADKEKTAYNLSLQMGGETKGISAPFGKMLGQMVNQTVNALPKAMIGGVATGTIAALSGVATITTPAAFGAGFTTMLASDTAAQIYRQEAGSAYFELREITDKEGNKIDDNLARGLARAVGSINMALEGASFGVLLTPFKIAARRMLRKKAVDMVADVTKRAILTESFKRGGIAMLTETGTELLQEQTNISAEKVGGKEHKEGEIFKRLYQTGSEVSRGMVPFALLGAGANVPSGISRISAQNKKRAAQILKKVGATPEEVDLIVNSDLISDEQLVPLLAEQEEIIAKDKVAAKKSLEMPHKIAKEIKAIDRVEKQSELISKGESLKGDKRTIKTKLGNAYRRGVADQKSTIASMFGTEKADYYDLSQPEQDKRVAVQDKRKAIDTALVDIYDDKNAGRTIKNLVRDDGYVLTGEQSGTIELNKLQLIDMYNSMKNEHSREMYESEFGVKEVNYLTSNRVLTENDIKFADFLQEQAQQYLEVLNQKNIEDTGENLGVIENYWPRKSETIQELVSHYKVQSNVPSAQKHRETIGNVVPVPQDAYLVALRHIEQAEWIDKVSRKYDENVLDFEAPKVKNFITRTYGKGVYKGLMDSINRNSLTANNKQVDFGFNIFNFLVNNWVVSNVAFNPTVIARQMGSVTNYAQHMNMGQWAVDFGKGIAKPKETFKYMWDNSEYLRARFAMGNSDATERALRDAERLGSWWGSFNNVLTVGSRATDIGAQIYGGYPLIKEFEKTMSTEEAFKKFEKISRREQQSGLQANLSNVQSNPYARWLFAFKNTPMQYARLQADAVFRYQNGEITKAQLTKVLALVGVVQPIMYSLMGGLLIAGLKAAGGEDEEKLLKELGKDTIVNMMSAPFNFMPLVAGATKTGARALAGKKSHKPLGMPVIDDFNAVISKLSKNEKTMEDWFVITSMLHEPVFPLPTGTAKRYYDYFADDNKKTTGQSAADIQ